MRLTIHGTSCDLKPLGSGSWDLESRFQAGLPRFFLVHLAKAPQASDRKRLARIGVALHEHMGQEVFLASAPLESPGQVQDLQGVRAVYPYSAECKLPPDVRALARRTSDFEVDVLLHPTVAAEWAMPSLAEAAGVAIEELENLGGVLRLKVATKRLKRLASLPAVRVIEAVHETVLCANVALDLIGATAVHEDVGFRGQGQVVAVADTGLDTGVLSDLHPHFEGRVLKLRPLGRKTVSSDPDGHGTHMAGLVVGSGDSPAGPGQVTGAAPDAQLVLQSTFAGSGRPLGGIPRNLAELFDVPYQLDGARIHSNSWAVRTPLNRYELCCRAVDDFVHRHRDLVVVFAVGNEGRSKDDPDGGILSPGTILPPSLAKNCIAVGASESLREEQSRPWRELFPRQLEAEATRIDGFADNEEGLAPISGCGPAFNGRLKPDLVAPGTAILSARSRKARRVSEKWGTSADPNYFFLGGSSPAAALVAGCAAVAREFLEDRMGVSPSAALVKALLINGARDLGGQYQPSETPGIPNVSVGWGRVDLKSSVAPTSPMKLEIMDEDHSRALSTPGQEIRFDFNVAEPNQSIRATLVWTDAPGEELQNDLDLIVCDSTGKEHHGNRTAEDPSFDRQNNVEQVVWADYPEGEFTVVVRAHRVVEPGQTFALVVRAAL